MRKNFFGFVVGILFVVGMVFAIMIVIKGRMDGTSLSDDSGAMDTDKTFESVAGGYSFQTPSNWYVEQTSGADTTIYPDYDPGTASSSPATCKIEISVLPAGDMAASSSFEDLSNWVTGYLHTDPTTDISEISRTTSTIDSRAAIEWQGILNSVATTLVYAVANGSVIEIAPSSLAEDITQEDKTDNADNGDNAGDCTIDTEALMSNVVFGKYQP